MAKTARTYLINGILSSEISSDFLAENRGFRLGDGFFETIRVVDGRIPFWNAHRLRLERAAKAWNMELPVFMERGFLLRSLEELLKHQGIREGGRLRITVFREGGGAYSPNSNRAGYVAEVLPYHPNQFIVADKGAKVAVYHGLKKESGPFSKFKMLGNQVSIQAGNWAKMNNLDEAILINSRNHIVETTSGNFFLVKNGKVKTPALKEGGVAGIMRMAVINLCLQENIPVFESELTTEDLPGAEELFFTNSMVGIKWIRSFGDNRYYHKVSDHLLNLVNKLAVEKVEA